MIWPSRLRRAAPSRPNHDAFREPFRVRAGRFFHRVFLFIFICALAAGGFYGTLFVRHFVYQTDYFKIDQVVVNGASPELERQARKTLDEVFEVCGKNLVDQDMSYIQSELTKIPRALKVQVCKVYPKSIKVEFTERQPLMVANLDETYLVDREGVLISRIHSLEATRNGLPILTGLQVTTPHEGDKLDAAQVGPVLAAVDFIQANDKDLCGHIVEWNINSKAEVTAILRGGAEVRFGTKPPLELMNKLSGAFQTPRIRNEFEQATYIDLRMDSQLVIMPKQL